MSRPLFDLWFLNLFPRPKPFEFAAGGYHTLNFISSLATMIFGLLVGELMRSDRRPGKKLAWLLAAGLTGLVVGYTLPAYAPIVEANADVLVLWLFCYWLYRQKVFFRI